MKFLRTRGCPLREVAWVLDLSFSVLSHWNQGFDQNMKPYRVPDKRGKASKITVEMVKVIVTAAESLKAQGKRLRLQGFSKHIRTEHGVHLSRKKVKEILIANDLFAPGTRRRRPRFYQSLRKEIPNGLVSLDGSEMIVCLDGQPYKFNVELSVDVKTFSHTAFSVADTETSDEVIKVLEAHSKDWGWPLGVLCDHGSSNLSEKTMSYLKEHEIELIPVGPANPKANGTDEGAFSQMKQVLGTIHLDLSSPRALAKCLLEKMISIYITMRNRHPLKGNISTPLRGMSETTSQLQQDLERQQLRDHKKARGESEEDQKKLDRLHHLIQYHGIAAEPSALKQAVRSIKGFQLGAIISAEEAFIRAVNRKSERKTLPYFFGILKRIQQERDDEAYGQYCRQRYNQQVMLDLQRQQEEHDQQSPCVENIVNMLLQATKASVQFVKELAIRKAYQWTKELMASYHYPGALKKRFSDVLGSYKDLSLDQKTRIWELIEQFLNPKTSVESVTRFS